MDQNQWKEEFKNYIHDNINLWTWKEINDGNRYLRIFMIKVFNNKIINY
jgi:hypothetical protein